MAVALQAMKQELLARPQLQQIIRDLDLYPKQSKRRAPEELISLMLRDIDISPLTTDPVPQTDLNAFRISFTAEHPAIAQQVTSRLTLFFIQQNRKTREEQASNTTGFLHEQLDVAKKQLELQEQRLRDFKMRYLGELPEQQQGNVGVLSSLQTQLSSTSASISRAQGQKIYLESLLSGYQATMAENSALSNLAAAGPVPNNRILSPIEAAQNEVDRLRAQKAPLLVRLTPQHPDVIRIDHDIAAAEANLQLLKSTVSMREGAPAPKPAGSPQISKSAPATENPAIAQLKSQLEANRFEIANLSAAEKRLQAQMAQYQERLNLTPVREQQLTGLLRDYDLQKKAYEDLVSKELQSQLATHLEEQQGGRQFRLVEPPSLPMIPTSPKRLKINLGGMAGGLVIGLALALLMEMRDRSFHTEKELGAHFTPPILVSTPLFLTPAEERIRSRSAVLQWLAGCTLFLIVSAVEFYASRS
jgi:polysaccharide chain length determinant protein (PEP-CTERM system associated)